MTKKCKNTVDTLVAQVLGNTVTLGSERAYALDSIAISLNDHAAKFRQIEIERKEKYPYDYD